MFDLLEWCPRLKRSDPALVALYERALWAPACEHARAIGASVVNGLRRVPAPEWKERISGLLRDVWASPLTSPPEVVLAYVALSRWLRGPGTPTWNEGYDEALATLKHYQQLRPVADAINRARRPSLPELAALIREELAGSAPADERVLAVYQEIAQNRQRTVAGPDASPPPPPPPVEVS